MRFFKRKSRPKHRLAEVLRGQELPVFPQSTARLLRMLRDPDTDAAELSEALSWDAGLVVRILKTVNSAAFGMARKIEDVQHALTLMGRTQVEQLVLGLAVRQGLPAAPARGFKADRFWQACFFRAALSRAIAGRLHPADQALSFTCGLLQDMAVPVLAHARPDDYGPVLEAWHGEKHSELHELEYSALGWTHAEVGAMLGEDWELPENLVRPIRDHHAGASSDWEVLPAVRLVSIHRETEVEFGLEALVEEGRSSYGLDPSWLQEQAATCDEQARELVQKLK